ASFTAPPAAAAALPVALAAPAAASLVASPAASIFFPSVSAGPLPSSRLHPTPTHTTAPAKTAATAIPFTVPVMWILPFLGAHCPLSGQPGRARSRCPGTIYRPDRDLRGWEHAGTRRMAAPHRPLLATPGGLQVGLAGWPSDCLGSERRYSPPEEE